MKRNHTARNLAILAVIVAIAVAAVSLPLLLQQPPAFVMVVHVYDPAKGNPNPVILTDLTEQQLIANANVTVPGASPSTQLAQYGIVAFTQLPAGTYQITVTAPGYRSNTYTYSLGPNCQDRTPDGECHPLVPMKTS